MIIKALMNTLRVPEKCAELSLVSQVRIVFHSTPVLKSLHWLPVNRRIQFKILLVTYKCLHGLAPNYLIDLIQISKPTRQLRSSLKLLLQKPFVKISAYGDRCFARAAADLWNIFRKNCNNRIVQQFSKII